MPVKRGKFRLQIQVSGGNIFGHATSMRLAVFIVTTWFLGALAATGAVDAHTQVRLVLAAESARPGETFLAGVHLKMDKGWHTYWENSGASGMPTAIDWKLPAGISAGKIQWPVPEKLPEEDLTTYIYHDEVVLLIPLTLARDVAPGPLEIRAKVSWLECEVMCLPGESEVSARLNVAGETKSSVESSLIQAWQAKLPRPADSLGTRAWWERPASGALRPLLIEWTAAAADDPDFYPGLAEGFEVQGATERLAADAGKIRLRKVVKKIEGDWPAKLPGVIVQGKGAARAGFTVVLSPGGSSTQTAAAGSPPAGAEKAEAQLPLWKVVLYAFLGGIILNIMPCVLPVIALKILGFVNESKSEPRRVRKLGLIYTLGVLASFLGLAALVIGLKAAGHKAGWGMQFASPQFTIGFTVLITLVALNLFGVFEIVMGGKMMGVAGDLASRHGAGGAFFNGVLATVLATPCTAPFLSVALGFAFGQSALVIAGVFLAVGAGLAIPYLLLSWYPAWLKFLPKPGPWMERFKQALGFPMLGTALWLASLVSDHYGEHAWWLGIFLVFVGMAAWVFGQFVQRGGSRRGLAACVALLLLATGYVWALEGNLRWRFPVKPSAEADAPLRNAPKGYAWQRWSAGAVAKARAEGKLVLVDFTAKWCITCNSIVKPALEREAVVAQLKQEGAVALLADYTAYPPEITEELGRFNRAGVPLVLVYPKDKSAPPVVLPDPNPLLGPGHYADLIVEALKAGAK